MIAAVDVALCTLASLIDWLLRNGVSAARIRAAVERNIRDSSG